MMATINVGTKVVHKKYGEGEVFKVEIIDGSSCTLHVKFESGEKSFHYPTIIKNDLVFGDYDTQFYATCDLNAYEEEIKYSALVNPLKLLLLEDEKEREFFYEVLDTVTPREKPVFTMFFGLDGEGPKKFSEIADFLGCDVEMVRAMFAKELRKLKHPSRAKHVSKVMKLLAPKEPQEIELCLQNYENYISKHLNVFSFTVGNSGRGNSCCYTFKGSRYCKFYGVKIKYTADGLAENSRTITLNLSGDGETEEERFYNHCPIRIIEVTGTVEVRDEMI